MPFDYAKLRHHHEASATPYPDSRNAIHDAIGTEINGACIGTYARDPYLPRGSILPKLWPVGLQAMVRKYP